MNSLVIYQRELNSAHSAKISGARAADIIERHGIKGEAALQVVIPEFGSGTGRVVRAEEGVLEFELLIEERECDLRPSALIVAVPRPQTIRKVIQLAVTTGVSELHFIRSRNTEKSYLSSKALSPMAIERECQLALEQCCSPFAPLVQVHQRFRPFLEDVLAARMQSSGNQRGVLACTGSVERPYHVNISAVNTFVWLAIGPESGWNNFEEELFRGQGFEDFSLGPRILRVETAAALGLGVIEACRPEPVR